MAVVVARDRRAAALADTERRHATSGHARSRCWIVCDCTNSRRTFRREEVAVGRVDHPAPYALLHLIQRSTAGAEAPARGRQVLAHGVVQPAHVARMANGVARDSAAESPDRSVRPSAVWPTSVSQVASIRGGLPAESVLRRDDDVGGVTGLAERRHERPRDHHVTAFDERRARRDDGDRAHGTEHRA